MAPDAAPLFLGQNDGDRPGLKHQLHGPHLAVGKELRVVRERAGVLEPYALVGLSPDEQAVVLENAATCAIGFVCESGSSGLE